MGRFNIVIPDKLDKRIREYCEANDMQFSNLFQIAVIQYFQQEDMSKSLLGFIKKEFGKRREELESVTVGEKK